jgi:hypothetical protein
MLRTSENSELEARLPDDGDVTRRPVGITWRVGDPIPPLRPPEPRRRDAQELLERLAQAAARTHGVVLVLLGALVALSGR